MMVRLLVIIFSVPELRNISRSTEKALDSTKLLKILSVCIIVV
jgi:hypothetical protein